MGLRKGSSSDESQQCESCILRRRFCMWLGGTVKPLGHSEYPLGRDACSNSIPHFPQQRVHRFRVVVVVVVPWRPLFVPVIDLSCSGDLLGQLGQLFCAHTMRA